MYSTKLMEGGFCLAWHLTSGKMSVGRCLPGEYMSAHHSFFKHQQRSIARERREKCTDDIWIRIRAVGLQYNTLSGLLQYSVKVLAIPITTFNSKSIANTNTFTTNTFAQQYNERSVIHTCMFRKILTHKITSMNITIKILNSSSFADSVRR